ncbi:hypothetical protein KJ707_04365 [Patescibacteria group bacterium]|nr:hypothetical protein [Patescibacteria group bacterium]
MAENLLEEEVSLATPDRRFAPPIENLNPDVVLRVGKILAIPYEPQIGRTHLIFGRYPLSHNRSRFENYHTPLQRIRIDVSSSSRGKEVPRRAVDFKFSAGRYIVTHLDTGAQETRDITTPTDDLRNWRIELGGGFYLQTASVGGSGDQPQRILSLSLGSDKT